MTESNLVHRIDIFVDGKHVAAVGTGELMSPKLLSSLVPNAVRNSSSWTYLEARDAGGRTMTLSQFGTRYSEHVAKLFKDSKGRATLGIFRRIRPNLPERLKKKLATSRLKLVDVQRIEIRTGQPAPPPPPTKLKLAIVGGVTRSIDRRELARVVVEQPLRPTGRSSRRHRGHPLREIVRLVVEPKRVASITIIAGANAKHLVTRASLLDPKQQLLLKRNRRQMYNLKCWHMGAKEPHRRIRDIKRIEMNLKK